MSKEPPNFVALVLAAGKGTRMKSNQAKVLHAVAGRPMVSWPVQAALDAGAQEVIVVVGHGREAVERELDQRFDSRVRTAVQAEQRGTGHAVACGLEVMATGQTGRVLVLTGDAPLVPRAALQALAAHSATGPLSLLTSTLEDPTGYGRIVRSDDGRVSAIREHRDCSPQELGIKEWNPAIYSIDAEFLRTEIRSLRTNNDQGELYLTDLVQAAAMQGQVGDVHWCAADLQGINDPWQLAQADSAMVNRLLRAHAERGVVLRNPQHIRVEADVHIDPGAILEGGVVLRGATRVGTGAHIDVGCVLEDVQVEQNARLLPYTVATRSTIGVAAQTGPFSHVRPDTHLGPEAKIGNFVETKKTRMGRGSKASHLAYLGDGEIGENVNVGAGTIFCNYDGVMKHVTTLKDGCFIGSDSQIVAPITVGEGAYVATGTTVTHDVPADALAVGRARQVNKDGYANKLRRHMEARKRAQEKPD